MIVLAIYVCHMLLRALRHTPVDVPGLGDAAVKRIIAGLGVNSIEAAADIVDALCANGTITADLLIRVKRRFDLLRQLRELDA
jgi:hypothetical protein